MDFLDFLGGDNNDLDEKYNKLLGEGGGTATGAMNQSDINRGANIGPKSPWSVGMDPTESAKLDRYAWGAQAGLGGLPVAAAYEGVKGLAPTLMPYLQKAAEAGFGNQDWFKQDSSSSPASFGNIGSYIRGAVRNRPSFLSFLGD